MLFLWLVFSFSSAFAGPVDITDDFVDYFTGEFTDSTSKADTSWDDTKCVLRDPLPPNKCLSRTGFIIRAEASATVEDLMETWGKMEMASDPFEDVNLVKTDVTMIFPYRGITIGRKYTHPGQGFVGHEWGHLHPRGLITIRWVANSASRYQVSVNYTVDGNHGDRPNKSVENAADSLKSKVRVLTEYFLRNRNVPATVTVD